MDSLLKVFHQWINQAFRDAIALDVRIDFVLVVAVITQRIEDLRKGLVWQALGDLFRRRAHSPYFYDCSNRRACAFDDWFTAQNLFVSDYVKIFGYDCHFNLPHSVESLPQFLLDTNDLTFPERFHIQSAVKSETDKPSRAMVCLSSILAKGIIPNRTRFSRSLSAY